MHTVNVSAFREKTENYLKICLMSDNIINAILNVKEFDAIYLDIVKMGWFDDNI